MHPESRARHVDTWLAATTIAVLAAATLWAWHVSLDERAHEEEGSYQVSDLLAIGMEAHLDETLRDARNAAYSAAVLLEKAPSLLRKPSSGLHQELNRELMDNRSIARLLVADAGGRILASSAEARVLPGAVLTEDTLGWHRSHAASPDLHLGVTRRSSVSGDIIVPYSRAVFARGGRIAGIVVAELNVGYFTTVYEKLLKGVPAQILWVDDGGIRLMRFPHVEGLVGNRIGQDVPVSQIRQGSGRREYLSPVDGRRYLFSYLAAQHYPVTVLVGQDKAAVLGHWRERTRHRAAFVAIFAVLFAGCVALLRRCLRRLARNEERLVASEAQLRMVSDNLPDGMLYQVVREPSGAKRFLYVSAAVERLNGVSKEAVLRDSMRLYGLVLAEDLPKFGTAVAGSVATMTKFDVEVRMRRVDGRVRWMRFCSIPRPQPDGSVVWDGIQVDVTERIEAEAKILSLNSDLEKRVEARTAELSVANRNLEAFAYSVAHDLRAPLHRIAGFSGLLRGRPELADAESGRKLGVICAEVGRMSEIIDGLLALSRTSRGELSRVPVALGSMAAEIAGDLGHQCMSREIDWSIGALPGVEGDPVLLRQVMANLIGNAVKFTRDRHPARIEVACLPVEDTPGETVIFVRDNGVGFDPVYAQKLFGVFQRLHAESEFEGNGIGLALVHRIVERHGGRVWASAQAGAGATFFMALPLADISNNYVEGSKDRSRAPANLHANSGNLHGVQAAAGL
jgi:PAS domain S-box-containing protein